MMLQQTQVLRVIPKYRSFLERFPTVGILAKAPQGDVLKAWQGLGYNRRALYLQRAAQKVIADFGGVFPESAGELETLPGVGPYTARAIQVFSHNKKEVFIETNIRRVYIHFFFPKKKNVSDVNIMPLIESTLPKENFREWYWALMDYGAQALAGTRNANQRSKHYTKQSKFEGSRRYARAKVLEFVISKNRVTRRSVAALYKAHPLLKTHPSITILSALTREGFIIKSGSGWSLV
jgi:A/G-specific adenine glycosylase